MGHRVDHCGKLALDHGLGLTRFTFVQGFTHTHDGRDAGRQRALRLRRHQGIGLTVVLTALGVADDGVAATEILEHGHTHLAGVRALLMGRNVLSPPGHRAALQQGLQLCQIGRRDAQGHVGRGRRALQAVEHGLDQGFVGGQRAVHFPVACDQFFHGIHSSLTTHTGHAQVRTSLPMWRLDSISSWAAAASAASNTR